MTRISVIIPSLGDAARAKSLDRAIESVLAQNGVNSIPIVVVNGNRHDPAVLESLLHRTDIRCEHLPFAGLPEARLRGREVVDTPFFAFLDDDDELLPQSLSTRLYPMHLDEEIDVVISNGFRDSPSGRVITDPIIDRFQANPLEGLMETNWLSENGGLYRTRSIGIEFFANLPPVVEWTYIAFQLAQLRNIYFIDVPTFVKHDTLGSLSKSKYYSLQHPYVLRDMLRWRMPEAVRFKLKQKYISALHQTSETLLEMRDFRSAWRYHLESLRYVNGLQFLGYTRHIVQKQFEQFFGRNPD